MTNLVQQLGDGYIREFFVGALFVDEDTLYSIRNCMDGRVQVNRCSLTGEEGWRSGDLPHEKLASFKSIAWPKLGYRNLLAGPFGNVAMFVTSTRSTMRGLRPDHLEWNAARSAENSGINVFSQAPSGHSQYQARQIFAPTFYTYKEGISSIKEGKWTSFAINEDLAITVSTSSSEGFCDILFRDKVVGTVSEAGEVHLSNKVIKRSALRRAFSGVS